jgi:hypothetical protein
MTRYVIALNSKADRGRAAKVIEAAPPGTRVEVKASRRSLSQNAKMWAALSDVAMQLPWHGQKLRPEDWKLVFLDALKHEFRMVPNLDNTGFVNLGRSSSDLSKSEMSDLIELIAAFGAQHGVKFGDEEIAA